MHHEASKVTVHALLYSRDAPGVGDNYRRFWVKNVEEMLSRVAG